MSEEVIKDPLSGFDVYVFKSPTLISKSLEEKYHSSIMSFQSIESIKDGFIKLEHGLVAKNICAEIENLSNNYKTLTKENELYILKDLETLPIIDIAIDPIATIYSLEEMKEMFNIKHKFNSSNKVDIILRNCKITNIWFKLMPGRRVIATYLKAKYNKVEVRELIN